MQSAQAAPEPRIKPGAAPSSDLNGTGAGARFAVESTPPTSPVSLGFHSNDFVVGAPTSFPARVDGKLFIVTANGQGETCSAAVVTSAGRSMIMTAAHCIYDSTKGGWTYDRLFVPAYTDGVAPFGKWVGANAFVPTAWINTGAYVYDVGALALDRNADGTPIESEVGSWGTTFNSNPNQYHQVIGYPSAPAPYNGQQMIACDTSFSGFQFQDTSGNASIAVAPCYQGHGASGGAYVTAGGQVQAVHSHSYCDVNGTYCGYDYGTYFGPAAQTVYNSLASFIPPANPYQNPVPTPPPSSSPTPQPNPSPAPKKRHRRRHHRRHHRR
jgi:hypothetical protein